MAEIEDPSGEADEYSAARLTRLFANQAAVASDKQRASVDLWQGKGERLYREVQRAVNGQDADVAAYDVADDLQDLMEPLPENVVVWRGVRSTEAVFGVPSENLEELVGTDRVVPRFFATSLDRNVAEGEFTRPGPSPALYRIAAQAGTPALWVPPLGSVSEVYQQELLFPPGVVVRILNVDRTYSVPIVEVEVSHGEMG
ncbi:hypothetical protein [Mycobacterium marinum]|uniref:hypothetical protein n=1 Tax=Mycobacterium marinum TaxID=1781 RepID=UPI0035636883